MPLSKKTAEMIESEFASHTQALAEAFAIREALETKLEGLKSLNQILEYTVKLVSFLTVEVLITVSLEIYSDLRKIAVLTEPLAELSTQHVTVVPYATFPLEP
jgi:hypothetical protein